MNRPYRRLAPVLLVVALGCDETGSDGGGGAGGGLPALPICGTQTDGIHVVSISPADGETDTLRMLTFEVELDQEIDCASVENGFTLVGTEGERELTALTCAGSPTRLTFQPASRLELVSAYTLRIDGVGSVEPCQASFVTKHKTVEAKAGTGVSVSRDENGTVWTWSDALAASAHDNATVPLKAAPGARATAIAAGNDYVLIALEDGRVLGVGQSMEGQLGTTTTRSWPPADIELGLPSGQVLVGIAAAPIHVLGLRSDGSLLAWGANDAGQLGDGTQSASITPITVPIPGVVREVAATRGFSGGGSAGSWSMALLDSGEVLGWGANNNAQLTGLPPDPYLDVLVPRQVIAGPATHIAAGLNVGLGLLDDRTALGWGSLLSGATGSGVCDGNVQPVATPVVGLDDLIAVAVGGGFGIALKGDGTVWGWGDNVSGAIGDGTNGEHVQCNANFSFDNMRLTPVQASNVADVVAISAGASHALLVMEDGTVLGAGYDANDVIGLGPNRRLLEGTDLAVEFQEVPGL